MAVPTPPISPPSIYTSEVDPSGDGKNALGCPYPHLIPIEGSKARINRADGGSKRTLEIWAGRQDIKGPRFSPMACYKVLEYG